MANVSEAAKLWGDVYALLCKWPSIQYGLATMPESDQPRLDDLAEQIIIKAVRDSYSRGVTDMADADDFIRANK